MIRIAICCGEGFSSGFLSRHLAMNTVRENMQDQVSFIFIPFYQLYERQNEADIAMIMPHIEPQVRKDPKTYSIPFYIIPYKVVIKPSVRDYLDDAEDILAMADGRPGVYCFPGEEWITHVSRLVSYRKYKQQEK